MDGYVVHEQVLGLEVAVDDVLLVHELQPLRHLPDYVHRLLLRQLAFLLDLLQ